MLVRCPSCQSTYRLDPERVPQHAVRVRCPRCTAVFRVAPPETAAPHPAAPAAASPPASPAAPPARPPVAPAPEANELGIEREAWQKPPRTRIGEPRQPAHPAHHAAAAPGGHAPAAPLPKRTQWTGEAERTLDFGSQAPKAPAPRLETAPFRPGGVSAPPPAAWAPAESAPPPAASAPAAAAPPPAAWAPAEPVAPRPVAMPQPSGFAPEMARGAAPAPPPAPPAFAAAPTPVRLPAAPPAPEPAGPALTRARRLARVLVSDLLVYNQAARDRALQEGSLATVLAPEISKAWDLYKTKVGPEVATSTPYFKDALNEILAGGATVF